jgi:hypothetical protein
MPDPIINYRPQGRRYTGGTCKRCAEDGTSRLVLERQETMTVLLKINTHKLPLNLLVQLSDLTIVSSSQDRGFRGFPLETLFLQFK